MNEYDEQLQDVCERSLAIVQAAKLPEPLQSAAFGHVFDALVVGVAAQSVDHRASPPGVAGDGIPQTSGLSAIANKAGVPYERVEEVFTLADNDLAVVVSSSRIDSSNAQGSRELTLLVAGGRQAAGLEDWTAISVARDVCSNYARFDSGNYASSVRAMDNFVSFRGQGANREVRLTMPGWDAWKDLVQRVLEAT